jgi:hypothetical protein
MSKNIFVYSFSPLYIDDDYSQSTSFFHHHYGWVMITARSIIEKNILHVFLHYLL